MCRARVWHQTLVLTYSFLWQVCRCCCFDVEAGIAVISTCLLCVPAQLGNPWCRVGVDFHFPSSSQSQSLIAVDFISHDYPLDHYLRLDTHSPVANQSYTFSSRYQQKV
ncbi:hypothetical protein IWZ00DRAFT_328114 [Phyllosticta capitalensis]